MYRIGQEEIDAVARVINSKQIFKTCTTERGIYKFEEAVKEKFNVPYVITMTSGKAALISALIGMGVGPGDEVIVPGYTYIATAIAVTAVGAIPVIAECDECLTLDPEDVERKISAHTKVILPVHIQGFPCDMDKINAIAKKHGLYVLEDACQADGASYHGKRLGTCGDAGAFSYNFFKIISAGEGGAVVTANRDIFERALIYHDSSAVAFFGNQLEGVNTETFCGTEFRVSEITGAILNEQFKKLDGIIADLHKNRDYLKKGLEGKYKVAPSHDYEGDLATTLALRFDTVEETNAFAARLKEKGLGVTIPVNTGKHVYTNWAPVLEHRGAFHPAFDPFKMKENQGLQMDYSKDMCPRTLDYLSRTAYIGVDPDMNKEQLDELIAKILAD